MEKTVETYALVGHDNIGQLSVSPQCLGHIWDKSRIYLGHTGTHMGQIWDKPGTHCGHI